MTPEFAISLLKKGNTGNEILTILDAIIEDLQPVEELAQA